MPRALFRSSKLGDCLIDISTTAKPLGGPRRYTLVEQLIYCVCACASGAQRQAWRGRRAAGEWLEAGGAGRAAEACLSAHGSAPVIVDVTIKQSPSSLTNESERRRNLQAPCKKTLKIIRRTKHIRRGCSTQPLSSLSLSLLHYYAGSLSLLLSLSDCSLTSLVLLLLHI